MRSAAPAPHLAQYIAADEAAVDVDGAGELASVPVLALAAPSSSSMTTRSIAIIRAIISGHIGFARGSDSSSVVTLHSLSSSTNGLTSE